MNNTNTNTNTPPSLLVLFNANILDTILRPPHTQRAYFPFNLSDMFQPAGLYMSTRGTTQTDNGVFITVISF